MLGGIGRDDVIGWSRRIEDDGYATVGFGERIAYRNLELFTTLSVAAAVTERVQLAATVVVLPMHSEVFVAKQMATLDVLSGGRAVLGVGVGGRREDYDALDRPFDRRFSRLDRQVARMRRLWEGESPGEGLDPVGPPPLGRIPILSGSLGPKSMARAAHWADGVAGFEMDPSAEALSAARDRMDQAWLDAGRTEAPYRMTSWWFALGDDAAPRLHSYAAGYLGVFGEELATAMAAACTSAGTDQVRRAVDAAREAGYDEIQLVPTTADLAELDRLSGALARS